jgi:hypothetical protein
LKKEALSHAMEKLRLNGGDIDTSDSRDESRADLLDYYSSSEMLQKLEVKETKMQKILNYRKD